MMGAMPAGRRVHWRQSRWSLIAWSWFAESLGGSRPALRADDDVPAAVVRVYIQVGREGEGLDAHRLVARHGVADVVPALGVGRPPAQAHAGVFLPLCVGRSPVPLDLPVESPRQAVGDARV